jgi:ribonuclease J
MSCPHPELALPPPLPDGGLRIVALGGLGEIGRNMTVFEYGGRLLIVDCGVLFPDSDQPGVDLVLPDFRYLEGRLDQVDALILTHAHEDHIGAVPYLLRRRANIPLVGSKLTLALTRSKLVEHRITPEVVEVKEGETTSFGPFECEFFAVSHSIPDAMAAAIKTPAGVVLHTGDFKMDQLPLDGRLTDLAGFARLGAEGVDLLLADSTNAEVPGIVRSERDIAPVLDEVFFGADQRIIVACFASHVHRVQQVLDTAVKHRRKVAFVGRSMVRNMGVARDLGYLHVPGGLLVDLRDAEELPPGEVVLISTGSQGEPMSALSRMAGRDHPIRIAAGDTVILASSLIPGNETAVYKVINGLTRLGARVVHKESSLVHVSGHAPAGELLFLLNLVKPRNFMPVHGEWRHLRAHARLASLTGVPDDRIVIAEDGVVVDLLDGKAEISGAVECGYVYVDGLTVGDVNESHLKDRRILGEEGFVSVIMVIDTSTGKVVGGPEIHARGSGIAEMAFGDVLPKVEEALERATADGIADPHALRQLARRVIGKWVSDNYRRRPMIIPVVVEVLSPRLAGGLRRAATGALSAGTVRAGDLGAEAADFRAALGDLAAHGVDADHMLAAEVRARLGDERPGVGDVRDAGLHRVKAQARLGDGPVVERVATVLGLALQGACQGDGLPECPPGGGELDARQQGAPPADRARGEDVGRCPGREHAHASRFLSCEGEHRLAPGTRALVQRVDREPVPLGGQTGQHGWATERVAALVVSDAARIRGGELQVLARLSVASAEDRAPRRLKEHPPRRGVP